MNDLFSIAIATMMISGSFLMLVPTVTGKMTPQISNPEPLDLGYRIRQQAIDISPLVENGKTDTYAAPGDHWVEGDVALYLTSMYGKAAWMPFTMRASGEYCELWTANDMTFPEGDERNLFTSRISLSDEQVGYIVKQFDENIYLQEKHYFSAPPPLNGSGGIFEQMGCPESQLFRTQVGGKTMIMVFNIVDENYWDASYPYYTIGYFSPLLESWYARNIIHIDVWDWTNRTGAQTLGPEGSYPYLYEMGIAHEYQHLLHNYLKPADPDWINEGCSHYAIMMCGYGVPKSDLAHYLHSPSNSLTVWGDQGDLNIAADYGAAALFMIYTADHFGGAAFISHLLRDPMPGEDGITRTLTELGYWQWTFPMVFKAWRLANLIRADTPGNGLYNYRSIDLDEIQALNISTYSQRSGVVTRSEFLGPTYSLEGGNTGVDTLTSYGVDYFRVEGFEHLSKMHSMVIFDGERNSNELVQQDMDVDFVVTMYFPATTRLQARVTDVPTHHVSDTGVRYLAWSSGYNEAYILVSPTGGPIDYEMGIVPIDPK